MADSYDAILILSFGGPETKADVVPFLQRVLRGKRVPHDRLLKVAEHYYHFGGRSPINGQIRELKAALLGELARRQISLPVYWGNRNWHPLLADTLKQMAEDGVRHALAWVTSAFGSYSGCRQYLDDIANARRELGASAPVVDKTRLFFNHPRFVAAWAERVEAATQKIPLEERANVEIVFTAHSIPRTMAQTCEYEAQLHEACRLVSAKVQLPKWRLAYQSRSGPPAQPWLEPDVQDVVRQIIQAAPGATILAVPIGFLSDHMEVLYDLDVEVRQLCQDLGAAYYRAETVGVHPEFVRMVGDLVCERLSPGTSRPTLGNLGPAPDVCPANCCRYET